MAAPSITAILHTPVSPPRSPAAGWGIEDDAIFNNFGSFDVVTAANTGYFSVQTANSAFNNYGSFVKSGDSGTAVFMIFGGLFNNSGSVLVDNGGLDLSGGTSSGSFTGNAGTSLSFSGQSFTTTSSITGDTVSFSDGDTVAGSYSAQTATVIHFGFGGAEEFTGTVSSVGSLTFVPDNEGRGGGIADFSLSSGPATLTLSSLTLTDRATLTGADSFVVTGAFNWTDGTLAGPSGTSLTRLGGIALDEGPDAASTHPLVLDGRTLNNGDPTHTGVSASLTGGGVALEDDAIFNNFGSFDVSPPPYRATSRYTRPTPRSTTMASLSVRRQRHRRLHDLRRAVQQQRFGPRRTGWIEPVDATNTGTVMVASGTTLGVGSYTQTGGSTVLSGGTITGGALDIDGGVLTGTGTINTSVTSDGQVIPGGEGTTGLLTINGNYTQTATGSLNIELGGTGFGASDLLAVSGAASLGGTLDIATLGSFAPAFGNTFQVMTFGSSAGNFNNIAARACRTGCSSTPF